ncbi:hypothetical protein DPEC_G00085620 [Dallia pectoralis]|uniref:Uncharacterized protein n=1 Tax=Dallia pectoralis TaxID=75939 RepID=A0ACC2H0A3_DALPE|nr:hypothetical protein DPEC_G00085620 [Dallia pectoralis]
MSDAVCSASRTVPAIPAHPRDSVAPNTSRHPTDVSSLTVNPTKVEKQHQLMCEEHVKEKINICLSCETHPPAHVVSVQPGQRQ